MPITAIAFALCAVISGNLALFIERGSHAGFQFCFVLGRYIIDGHNIDFLKGKVAFDLEWNSKDQTFDRDLLAMRTYFDCGLIDVGVIVPLGSQCAASGRLGCYGCVGV